MFLLAEVSALFCCKVVVFNYEIHNMVCATTPQRPSVWKKSIEYYNNE